MLVISLALLYSCVALISLVVKTTVLFADLNDFDSVNAIYATCKLSIDL